MKSPRRARGGGDGGGRSGSGGRPGSRASGRGATSTRGGAGLAKVTEEDSLHSTVLSERSGPGARRNSRPRDARAWNVPEELLCRYSNSTRAPLLGRKTCVPPPPSPRVRAVEEVFLLLSSRSTLVLFGFFVYENLNPKP